MIGRRRRPNKKAPTFAVAPLAEQDRRWQELNAQFPDDHFVRRIVRGVAQLDLTALRESYAGSGSLPFPPEPLLAMVLIELHQGKRSPSQWHTDAAVNAWLEWAGHGIRPSRSTWYEFRARIASFMDDWNRQVLQDARGADLTSAENGAQDGSFVEAHASRHRLINEDRLSKRQLQLAANITADEQGESLPMPGWMARTPRGRLLQQHRYEQASQQLQKLLAANERRIPSLRKPREKVLISVADPEAALGLDKLKVFRPLYNIQLISDVDSPFILGYQAFAQTTDAGTMDVLLAQATSLTDVPLKRLLVDAGYVTGQELAVCRTREVELLGPWKENDFSAQRDQQSASQLSKDQFQWLPESNAYQCPQGHILKYIGCERRTRSADRVELLYRYQCAVEHCQSCPLQASCTKKPGCARSLRRSEHEELIEQHRARMATACAKELYKRRCCTVERSFADVKTHRGLRRVTGRGLKHVRAELALTVLTHNLITLRQLTAKQATPSPPPPE
jgi:transposase